MTEQLTDVRKALRRGAWHRWDELSDLDRLTIRYETPEGFDHAAYEWMWGGEEWWVRTVAPPGSS